MIRFTTAGESHGEGILVVLEGIPAGLTVSSEDIDLELARRQKGYGRSQRMNIETDCVKIFSGVRYAKAIGSPITMYISNRDFKNWLHIMSTGSVDLDGTTLLKTSSWTC